MNTWRGAGSDLVLSMTLAEVFLLLLIVGWYGLRLESEAASSNEPSPQAVLANELKRVKMDLQRAEDARRAAEQQLEEHQRILKWLQSVLALPASPRDPLNAQQSLDIRDKRIRDEARRGKPVCAPSNQLIQVVADDDAVSVTMLDNFDGDGRQFAQGVTLTEDAEIDSFLRAIDAFYANRRQKQGTCAFDYALDWRTDRDYRTARQRFEGYFYPAGMRQLQ